MRMALRALISILSLSLLSGAVAQTQSASVSDIGVGYDGERTRVVIDADHDLDYSQFALVNGGLRYVLDFDRLSWNLPGQAAHQGEGEGAGGIQRYRFAHNSAETSRLVFDLDEPLLLESAFTMTPGAGESQYRIVIDFRPTDLPTFESIRPRSDIAAAPVTRAVEERLPAMPEPTEISSSVSPAVSLSRHVVVIDPGHGGRDPGASGILGTREKDVNLDAALVLRDLLEASSKYNVVLTRESDEYVEHNKRIEIARNAGADIFLSIHADAAGSRAVAGASVYTLSRAGDARIERVSLENGWTIPLETEPVGEAARSILEDFVTRETLTKSGMFADLLIPELEEVGPILRNSHRQANFYVLLAPDVPAVLLEIGFLTNPNDERRLSSDEGINSSMGAVQRAIDAYFAQEGLTTAQYMTRAG